MIYFRKHKFLILFIFLVLIHIFLRFYQLFERANFDWDQVDSAWAAKSVLVDKHFFIDGPVAKGNSGIHMGPLYFYAISIFYFFTNLDPIASPLFQGVLSIVNLFVVFFITKRLFGTKVAFLAGFINTFSLEVLHADRGQSAYYLIVPISFLIFYALYQTINGKMQMIPLLGFFTGLSFHIDFTSVFYPILIALSLPFFLQYIRNKKFYVYLCLGLLIFLTMLSPTIAGEVTSKSSSSNGIAQLLHTSYHGFHLKRLLQIAHDGFISVEQILQFRFLRPFVFFLFPIFFLIYYAMNKDKQQNLKLFYLMSLWILVPWIILATYSGELTDYYFSPARNIVIAILAYLTWFMFQRKLIILKLIPVIFWGIYMSNSVSQFFTYRQGDLVGFEAYVKGSIRNKQGIRYKAHEGQSYIYYVYMRQKKNNK